MINLPNSKRVWMITDTHLGVRNSAEEWVDIHRSYFYDEFIPLVKREYRPGDVLFHLGDVFDSRHAITLKVMDLAIDIFEELSKIFVDGIYIIAGNHDCLDANTELLTKRGWIQYHEIKKTDEILSHLPDGSCKWDIINDIIIKQAGPYLNSVVTQHINLRCTDGHRVLHQIRKSNNLYSDFQYAKFQDIKGRIKIPVSGLISGTSSSLSDDEIRLMGLILTDGCIQKNRVVISQSKDADFIYKILDNLGYKYYTYVHERNITEICGKKLKNKPLPSRDIVLAADSTKLIKQILPSKDLFNHMFFNFDNRQFEIFINSCIDGDGSRYKNRNCSILYGKKQFLDHIQAMCVKHGYRAMLHKSNRGDWRLNIIKRNFAQFDVSQKRKKIKYTGDVWCLSVPETNFMVRLEGKAFFTGNCWHKNSNTINSLKALKLIPNVHVIDVDPATIKVGDAKFLMMPWRKDHDADLDAIRKYVDGHDYLMCHMDVYGMKGSRFNTIDSGVDVRAFSQFMRVYSGHIHYRQQMENVVMLGTPYELTRSDMYNEKCVTLLHTDDGSEVHYKNSTSPRFVSMQLSVMLEKSPEQLSKHFKNNFVDIHVDNINLMKIPVNSIVDMLDGSYRDIKFIPPNQFAADSENGTNKEMKDFDIKDTIRQWCEESMYDEPTKERLVDSLLKLYDRTLESYKK